mmetsp:Transcript_4742/g.13521  ORF Transcript_4742/g.13521 Transcript_4742/m.13521 type:complete len:340 (+) Transcript_4742:1456-2475(+)
MPWECSSTASATAGRRFRRSSLLYHNRIRSPCRPRLTVSTEANTTPECSHQALAAAFEESNVFSSKKSTESKSTGVTAGVTNRSAKAVPVNLPKTMRASRASRPVKSTPSTDTILEPGATRPNSVPGGTVSSVGGLTSGANAAPTSCKAFFSRAISRTSSTPRGASKINRRAWSPRFSTTASAAAAPTPVTSTPFTLVIIQPASTIPCRGDSLVTTATLAPTPRATSSKMTPILPGPTRTSLRNGSASSFSSTGGSASSWLGRRFRVDDGPGLNMSCPPGEEGGGLAFLRSARGGLFMKLLKLGILAVFVFFSGWGRQLPRASGARLLCCGRCGLPAAR